MSTEFRGIVRLAGRDLDGTKRIVYALKDIKGLNVSLSSALVNSLKLDPRMRLGQLSDAQLMELEKVLKDLRIVNLPPFLFNRRKDIETGENSHLFESDLAFVIKNDIEREKLLNSWRGIRHSLGLKVRGQRTRTTGRKGQTVGVRKAAVQAAASKEEEKKE
ncbi:MAG: 30S ribosomal protein S13 [Conexivisphaerales archaeon]